VIVFFEGQVATIDIPDKSILGDVIRLAVQCFSIPLASEGTYIVIDPKLMHICRLCDEVTAPILVLKRADLYEGETVFSTQGVIDMPELPVFMVSKLLISAPMKALLSAVRSRHDKPLELCEINEDRFRLVFRLFLGSQDLSQQMTVAEQNSLLFVLLGSNTLPLVSKTLHKSALAIMDEPSDVRKIDMLILWVLYIPFETHIILSELGLAFGGARPIEETRRRVASLITATLFSNAIDRPTEQRFVSLILLLFQWLFGYPAKRGRRIRKRGDRLFLVDGAVTMAFDGPVSIDVDETEEFEWPKDYARILLMTKKAPASRDKGAVCGEFAQFNEKLLAARAKAAEHSDVTAARRGFGKFEFDALFEM
jgi:hypothetical protein